MPDDTGKGTRDQAVLLKVIAGGKTRVPDHPYCGYGGDGEALEEILWSYAEGELPAAEEEALEEHTDSCQYCRQRLAVICRCLEEVAQEPGYSPGKGTGAAGPPGGCSCDAGRSPGLPGYLMVLFGLGWLARRRRSGSRVEGIG